MNSNLKKVTKEQFWNAIMSSKLDICPSLRGEYPHKSIWKNQRTGEILGKWEEIAKVHNYFISESLIDEIKQRKQYE